VATTHEKILGLVSYDVQVPSVRRIRETLWNAEHTHLLVPTFFGVGWTVNLRSAPRHPLQTLSLAAFIIWRLRMGQRC
jgi:hypothetical protein